MRHYIVVIDFYLIIFFLLISGSKTKVSGLDGIIFYLGKYGKLCLITFGRHSRFQYRFGVGFLLEDLRDLK